MENNNDFETFPAPKNPIWVSNWESQVKVTKLLFSLVFALGLVLVALGIVLLVINPDGQHIAGLIVTITGGVLLLFFTPMWINTISRCKIKVYEFDGYTALIYINLWYTLVIENKVVASAYNLNNSLNPLKGKLPNGKEVWVSPVDDSNGPITIELELIEKEQITQIRIY